jgi:hypothetical protein
MASLLYLFVLFTKIKKSETYSTSVASHGLIGDHKFSCARDRKAQANDSAVPLHFFKQWRWQFNCFMHFDTYGSYASAISYQNQVENI